MTPTPAIHKDSPTAPRMGRALALCIVLVMMAVAPQPVLGLIDDGSAYRPLTGRDRCSKTALRVSVDASGNIIEYDRVNGATVTSELRFHDAADQLFVITGARQVSLEHDPRGNVTGITEGGLKRTLTWDTAGRLLGVTGNTTLTADYADSYQLSLIQDDQQPAVIPLWGLDNILAEIVSGTGAEQNWVLHLPELDSPMERAPPDGGARETLLTDHLMSAIATIDDSGTVIRTAEYGAYGQLRSGTESGTTGYAGARRLGSTGFLALRNRVYAPELGRFLSRDPIGFAGGTNQYSYVGNNPAMRRDPSGLVDPVLLTLGVMFAGVQAYNHSSESTQKKVRLAGQAALAAVMASAPGGQGVVLNDFLNPDAPRAADALNAIGLTQSRIDAANVAVASLSPQLQAAEALAMARASAFADISATLKLNQLRMAQAGSSPCPPAALGYGGGHANNMLKHFAKNTDSVPWMNWHEAGITAEPFVGELAEYPVWLDEALGNTGEIRFNLTGILDAEAAADMGKALGWVKENVTHAELNVIRSRPELWPKTKFFRRQGYHKYRPEPNPYEPK